MFSLSFKIIEFHIEVVSLSRSHVGILQPIQCLILFKWKVAGSLKWVKNQNIPPCRKTSTVHCTTWDMVPLCLVIARPKAV